MSTFPIGIFDSGLGGLSIYTSLQALLPDESYIYVGDNANAPYSSKSSDFIINRVMKALSFFSAKQVKLIVIACNTATIAGIARYRSKYPSIPIVGVVPVIKTATSLSKTKHIAILATKFTVNSEYQKQLIAQFAFGFDIVSIGNTSLVALIEKGITSGSELYNELMTTLKPVLHTDVDILVLGSTHFPHIRTEIEKIVSSSHITVIDSGAAVARQVQSILVNTNLHSPGEAFAAQFFTSGDASTVSVCASKLLKQDIAFENIVL